MSPAAPLGTTAADTCACQHQQDRHYRGRGVCRSLSCPCSSFRPREGEDVPAVERRL